MLEVDRAWAAGFYDGEGCSSKGKRISICQKDRQLLDKFQSIVGVGKVYGPYGKSQAYHYKVFNHEAGYIVMQCLWPYLGEIKRAQALQAGFVRMRSIGQNMPKEHPCFSTCG